MAKSVDAVAPVPLPGTGWVETPGRGPTVPAPARNVLRAPPNLFPVAQEKPVVASELWLEVITERSALGDLQPEWMELAEKALEPNPFYEPWMALPALEAFALESPVRFVCVFAPHPSGHKGERMLCGLFPIEQRRSAGPIRVPMLGLWKYPYAYLSTPLLRAQAARETLSVFLDWLGRGGRDQGLLRLEDVPGDGPFRQAIVDELNRRGWPSFLGETCTRGWLARTDSAEAYLDRALSGKRRKEFRRQQARLSELGTLSFTELGPDEDVRPWAADFATLEALGWKGKEGVAVASKPNHRRFFEDFLRHAALNGRLNMTALRLNGKPIAMKLNLLAGQGSFAFKITYDEQYARFSPGVLLELDNIQRLHSRTDVAWMDSCAAHNRFMINHLWTERREMQTLFLATDAAVAGLYLALLPLVRWTKRQWARRAGSSARDLDSGQP